MSRRRFEAIRLPVAQQWSCHQSGGCCREHRIAITAEEARRIEQQGWQELSEETGSRLFQPGDRSGQTYFLAQRPDGSCVFLDQNGLCRIHAQFGEAAKPMACRLFPFVPVPLGPQVRVSLRFSCPSVVRNAGSPGAEQQGYVAQLWNQLLQRDGHQRRELPLPLAARNVPVASWDTLLVYLDAASRLFTEARGDFRVQLLRLVAWHARALSALALPAHEAAAECDRAAVEVLGSVGTSALQQAPPGRLARLILRTVAARVARRDRLADRGLVRAIDRGLKVIRLSLLPRTLPALGEFASVRLRTLHRVSPAFGPEIAEPLFRYARIKLWSGQFCGAACFGISVHEGLLNLALLLVLTIWLARWHAAARGVDAIDSEAIETALRHVDHHFGFDPFLSSPGHRLRLRYLWTSGQLIRLIAHGGDRADYLASPPSMIDRAGDD